MEVMSRKTYVVSIHAPYAGSDPVRTSGRPTRICFNPRPLCRERHSLEESSPGDDQFQSTPPMQGATSLAEMASSSLSFQSTPPMQGATSFVVLILDIYMFQSTPPMQGATICNGNHVTPVCRFNPRPLCRERRSGALQITHRYNSFNPRPLCRERPGGVSHKRGAYAGFNPRPLCRERLGLLVTAFITAYVSIHAPYAGSDRTGTTRRNLNMTFQSTPPMQGATCIPARESRLSSQFQSTPPMQGATHAVDSVSVYLQFQSTPPMQGATAISAKNSSLFSAEIDKLSFQILKFPLFSSPLRLQNTPFVHI